LRICPSLSLTLSPFTPDLATPVSKFASEVKKNNWPAELKVPLIGSCTNSSYEGTSCSASIANSVASHDLHVKSKFTITPGSEQVRATIERDGQISAFEAVGGLALGPAAMTLTLPPAPLPHLLTLSQLWPSLAISRSTPWWILAKVQTASCSNFRTLPAMSCLLEDTIPDKILSNLLRKTVLV
jgi:hypothetical protein